MTDRRWEVITGSAKPSQEQKRVFSPFHAVTPRVPPSRQGSVGILPHGSAASRYVPFSSLQLRADWNGASAHRVCTAFWREAPRAIFASASACAAAFAAPPRLKPIRRTDDQVATEHELRLSRIRSFPAGRNYSPPRAPRPAPRRPVRPRRRLFPGSSLPSRPSRFPSARSPSVMPSAVSSSGGMKFCL